MTRCRTKPSRLGNQIKRLRGRTPIRRLAEQAGVPHSTVHGLERGWQLSTSAEKLARIASALGVDLAALLAEPAQSDTPDRKVRPTRRTA